MVDFDEFERARLKREERRKAEQLVGETLIAVQDRVYAMSAREKNSYPFGNVIADAYVSGLVGTFALHAGAEAVRASVVMYETDHMNVLGGMFSVAAVGCCVKIAKDCTENILKAVDLRPFAGAFLGTAGAVTISRVYEYFRPSLDQYFQY